MEVVYFLIPISLLLVLLIIYFLFWAIRSGQFDDLEGAGYQILMDDDSGQGEEDTHGVEDLDPDPEPSGPADHLPAAAEGDRT